MARRPSARNLIRMVFLGAALAHQPGCPADMNRNGVTDLLDFLGFANAFNAQQPEGGRRTLWRH